MRDKQEIEKQREYWKAKLQEIDNMEEYRLVIGYIKAFDWVLDQ